MLFAYCFLTQGFQFLMHSQTLADHARRRLEISQRERIRFRVAPQIALEVLLILAAEGGSTPLTSLFDRISAAEKSVRSHVRTLMALGLVHEERHSGDKRAKMLRLTPRGLQDLHSYAQECRDGGENGPACTDPA
jgi:DNA-binding MarR family transcriptional regulator